MKSTNDTEPTIQDVLNVLNHFSTHTDGQFSSIDEQFEKVHSEIATIKSSMVTKDYLDDKLSDLKGELISTIRREDQKINLVVTTLHRKKLLSSNDLKPINQIKVLN